ncbi:SixA phosphatase family protein [Geminicoccus harenae]|uniref:SixA phosphatase family protein n=2 Tax=Geminicoccus harenae TaxID=2498453 RepID=UPI001C9643E2|nr:histidine phosphatase family protein [Geminicoccus harenae]
MVTVLLLRHAKSRWDEPDLADHDRGLAPRGLRAAPAMGRHAARQGWLPDRVIASTARRAAETARLFLEGAKLERRIEPVPQIYEATARTLLSLLQTQPGGDSILLVGHDPGIHDLALELVGSGVDQELDRKFPTAALAVIELPVEHFADLRSGNGRLIAFVRPRELG